MLKVLLVVTAGVFTVMVLRHIISGLQAAKARVKVKRQDPRAVKRLRQDPRTGVYYPEE